MSTTYSFKRKPDAEHLFWLFSPEGDGMTFWKTEEERDDYAEKEIRTYLYDTEWMDEVEEVMAGTVTHVTRMTNIQRPVGVIDDEGYDEEGFYWSNEHDFKCDFQLQPIEKQSHDPPH